MLEVFDYELAACSQKVRLTLSELGIPWRRHRVDLMKQEHQRHAYLSLNAKGVVPTLVEDGQVLTEADIIMEFLCERSASRKLQPASAYENALVRHWFKTIEGFHMSYGAVWYHEVALPLQRLKGDAALAETLENFSSEASRERFLKLMEHGIPQPRIDAAMSAISIGFHKMARTLDANRWLTGDSFTLADIAIFPYVNTPMRAVSSLWEGVHPSIQNWYGRVREREFFVDAVLAFPPDAELSAALEAAPRGGRWRD